MYCGGGRRGWIHLSVFPPCANVSFSNQTNGSVLCSGGTFLQVLSEKHVIHSDQRGFSAIKIENPFWMSVSSHMANINLKCHSMLGNDSTCGHSLHNMWGRSSCQDYRVCALTEHNLDRLISFPSILHSLNYPPCFSAMSFNTNILF